MRLADPGVRAGSGPLDSRGVGPIIRPGRTKDLLERARGQIVNITATPADQPLKAVPAAFATPAGGQNHDPAIAGGCRGADHPGPYGRGPGQRAGGGRVQRRGTGLAPRCPAQPGCPAPGTGGDPGADGPAVQRQLLLPHPAAPQRRARGGLAKGARPLLPGVRCRCEHDRRGGVGGRPSAPRPPTCSRSSGPPW